MSSNTTVRGKLNNFMGVKEYKILSFLINEDKLNQGNSFFLAEGNS
jgi:hypothetical protein